MHSKLQFRSFLLLVGIFYLNFLSRIVLAPLLPILEVEFGLGYRGAGSLFLFIAIGYCVGLLVSPFISSLLNHKRTVILSAMGVGGIVLIISRSTGISKVCLSLLGVSAGFYLPSGMAIITELIKKQNWGRALAIHEMAPNLALVTAPLLVEVLLRVLPWRGITVLIGASSILMGTLFFLMSREGEQKGKPTTPETMRKIFREPVMWIILPVFALSVGASDGVYAMLPLFLVNEIGIDRQLTNMIMGFSRIPGIVILLFSGLIIDRIGPILVMAILLTTTGISTLMLGVLHGALLTPVLVFLQAISSACFLPAALTAVSFCFPHHLRSLVISFVVTVSIFCGVGMTPLGIGYLAELSSFSFSFAILGILILAMVPLIFRIRIRLELHGDIH